MKSSDKSNISSKTVEDLDLYLAEENFEEGFSDEHGKTAEFRQYIAPICYGNLWRRCDIPVPRVPRCYTDQHKVLKSSDGPLQTETIQNLLKWSVLPPNVVQLESLPTDLDMELLHDIVAHYGTIVKSEVQKTNQETFLRFKLRDADSCDWLVTNINDEDLLGTGNKIKCSHIKT
ncbi:methyltransferase-like protein 12, mitochondrial [Plakobranchus ocellatus]|uniref:Methyltransferase-like protein 12, mitochondrial n=1 Tax=Plakobranchus ocellatus TaxID=259542 RepID=A0AAV4D3X6_9GAST|nr:methyltransferase-like protein 12, mitochondrial [Plakobranchus ocellatus]